MGQLYARSVVEARGMRLEGVDWLDWPCGQNSGRSPKATNAR